MGDGNLQGDPKWRIDFTSKHIKELRRFELEMDKAFSIKGKIRKCLSNRFGETYNIAFNCSPIARILFLCGVPSGQKVLQKFDIPHWIKTNKVYFRRFCQRLFSCEGSIMDEPRRRIPQVRLHMWKSEQHLNDGKHFFNEISRLMKYYFDIDSKISIINRKNMRKDGIITRPMVLYIFSNSVLIFHKEIGFEGEKQEKLTGILTSKAFKTA